MSGARENQEERHCRETLEGVGFRVVPIPEVDSEGELRADYEVCDASGRVYIVEVKGKEPSGQFKMLLDAVERDGIAVDHVGLGSRNQMSAIIRDAASQIRGTPSPQGAFRILWLACLEGDCGLVLDQFWRTLYGALQVSLFDEEKVPPTLKKIVPCFYWGMNEFFKIPDIDAAVLAAPRGQTLCVNSFGRRVGDLRQSGLYGAFGGGSGVGRDVCDPRLMESRGGALIADMPAQRKDQQDVWRAVTTKYGLRCLGTMAEVESRGIIAPRSR